MMQWLGPLLLVSLLILGPAYANAASQGNGPFGAGSPATSTRTYTPEEKSDYQNQVSTDLDRMQQKIHELEVKARSLRQQEKRMAIRSLLELQRFADAARRQLAALKTLSDKDWSAAKAGMDKAMAGLDAAYQQVKDHLN